MKAREVRDMKAEELPVQVTRLRQKLFELRSQAVTEKLENPMQLKEIRRDIARLLTERRRRELKEAS